MSAKPSSMTSSSTSDFTDLGRAVEEFGDEQVFALGGELDDARGSGGRDPGVPHQAERVVLVLDQPPHRLERRFVLEPSVEDGAAGLVPAVGTHVVHRVQLPEQVRVRITRDVNAQRGGPARTCETDGFDLQHGEAELCFDRLPNRFATTAPDIEVRGLAPPYVTGNTSLGTKKRNALSGNATATAMLTRTSKG